jgi:hypothetical protein
VLACVIIIIGLVNVRLRYQPEIIIQGADTIQYELVKELRGLQKELNEQADVEMQKVYPEGYIFLNAVDALAWTSFLRHQEHHEYFAEGHAEIQKAWTKIDSENGKLPFSEDLPLPYGAFYNGWSSYVLGSKLRLEPVSMRDEQEIHQFRKQCDKIANAIQQATYPESYPGAAWPADAMLCVASLSIHDEVFEPRYIDIVKAWLQEVKQRLDSRGMVPHAVRAKSGMPAENARGSSMALMLIFLRDIDLQFAQDQFLVFNKHFIDSQFGLTGIREYAKSESGNGDIDSGPVILGFGGAATIVGMQTLSLYGEDEPGLKVRNTVEAFGIPIQSEGHKQYLLGELPIADAFIAWSHSRMKNELAHRPLFLRFHIISLLIVALLSVLFWMILNQQRAKL